MLAQFSRRLLVAVLFVLQGLAPLVHAHPDGHGAIKGVHLDGIRQVVRDANTATTLNGIEQDESPGIGVPTPRRDDERLQLPVAFAAAQDAHPAARKPVSPLLRAPAPGLSRSSHHLLPAPRAPPPVRLS
jgi:hypothetical protein